VVTAAAQARRVRQELPELPPGRVLAEPRARNTAPAILLAAHAARALDPDAVLAVLPADAWAPRAGAYRNALRRALRAAEAERALVLVGIRPTRPETGYGYIEPGPGEGPWRPVRRFVEKPDAARAQRLAASGRHLWNAGIFAWRADVYIDAVERHLPALARAFRPLVRRRSARAVARAYARAPGVSVDVGVLERARGALVVPGTFPWDDLGSWSALTVLGRGGAFRRGRAVAADAHGLVVWAESGVVAALGVRDLVIVHTADATLVVPRARAQEIRRLVELLERTRWGRSLVEG
jgi:mannose-1-phosphate guanylyltransferase